MDSDVVDSLMSGDTGDGDYQEHIKDASVFESLTNSEEWKTYEKRLKNEMALLILKFMNMSGDESRAMAQGAMIQMRRILNFPSNFIKRAESRASEKVKFNRHKTEVE